MKESAWAFLFAVVLIGYSVIPLRVRAGLGSYQTVLSYGNVNYPTTFFYQGANLARPHILPGHLNSVPSIFSIVKDLGINTLIVNAGPEGGQMWNLETEPNWAENLDSFLTVCSSYGLRVAWHEIVSEWMFGFHVGEDLALSKSKVDMLAGNNRLAKNFLTDPRIAFWIVKCEANLSDPTTLNWVREVSAYMKQKDANVSASKFWERSQIHLVRDASTHLAVNIYPPRDLVKAAQNAGNVYDVCYPTFVNAINEVIAMRGTIPLEEITIAEFGLWHGTFAEADGHVYTWTEETRSEYYRAAFQACKDTGIGGAFPFTLFDVFVPAEGVLNPWGAVALDGTYYTKVTDQYKTYYSTGKA